MAAAITNHHHHHHSPSKQKERERELAISPSLSHNLRTHNLIVLPFPLYCSSSFNCASLGFQFGFQWFDSRRGMDSSRYIPAKYIFIPPQKILCILWGGGNKKISTNLFLIKLDQKWLLQKSFLLQTTLHLIALVVFS